MSERHTWLTEFVFGNDPPFGTATASGDLDALAKWLATGFALLSGVLTFFGVKEGTLARGLRVYPDAALAVFCFVGGAVVASVAVAVLPATKQMRAGLVVVVVAVLGWVGRWAFPDFGEKLSEVVAIVGTLAVTGFLAWILWNTPVTVTAATLIVATTALTLGLYGAAKIGVEAATFATNIQATAAVTREGDSATAEVAVAVKATGLDTDEVLRVVLLQDDPEGAEEQTADGVLGEVVIVPELAGDLDRTVAFRVPAVVQFVAVRVAECTLGSEPSSTDSNSSSQSSETDAATSSSTIRQDGVDPSPPPAEGGPGQDRLSCPVELGPTRAIVAVAAGTPVSTTTTLPSPTPTMSASVSATSADGPASVEVEGANVPSGGIVSITVTRAGEAIATSRLTVADTGAFTWTVPVDALPGVTISVDATLNAPGIDPVTATAFYTIPP